jgi:putative heme transporter
VRRGAERRCRLFLLAYPLTLLPMSGLGVLDALLVAGFTDLCGIELEPEVVAGLVVWRTVTLLGPLLLGVGTLGWWHHHHPSARTAG